MKVELIAYTQPAGKLLNTGIRGPKELIAYCARVSNPANQMNSETSNKLLLYLKKHKHWSPFEQVDVTLEVESTRDIVRQMLRHRSFCFQEFSQRYADVEELGTVFEFSEARLQDTKNRQNSVAVEDPILQETWLKMQKQVAEVSLDRKSTRLNSSHIPLSRMPSSA